MILRLGPTNERSQAILQLYFSGSGRRGFSLRECWSRWTPDLTMPDHEQSQAQRCMRRRSCHQCARLSSGYGPELPCRHWQILGWNGHRSVDRPGCRACEAADSAKLARHTPNFSPPLPASPILTPPASLGGAVRRRLNSAMRGRVRKDLLGRRGPTLPSLSPCPAVTPGPDDVPVKNGREEALG